MLNERVDINGELGGILKDVNISYIKVLLQLFTGGEPL
jgi:hypothetical protein